MPPDGLCKESRMFLAQNMCLIPISVHHPYRSRLRATPRLSLYLSRVSINKVKVLKLGCQKVTARERMQRRPAG